MSGDDAFAAFLRGAAAMVWFGRLLRVWRGHDHGSGQTGRLVTIASFTSILVALFVGALNTALGHPLASDVMRLLYTTVATLVLVAGVALWR